MGTFAEHAPETARAGQSLVETEQMPRDVLEQRTALREFGLDVRQQLLDDRIARRQRFAMEQTLDAREDVGIVIRRAAEHHTVDVLQMLRHGLGRRDAAVDDDAQPRKFLFSTRIRADS